MLFAKKKLVFVIISMEILTEILLLFCYYLSIEKIFLILILIEIRKMQMQFWCIHLMILSLDLGMPYSFDDFYLFSIFSFKELFSLSFLVKSIDWKLSFHAILFSLSFLAKRLDRMDGFDLFHLFLPLFVYNSSKFL